jgi:2-C-methyl-D-erythritol 2,4-cyclodiphosphate synthase
MNDERGTTNKGVARTSSLIVPRFAFRIGHGYDIHRFGGSGELALGGVRFPRMPALAGHSDGDAVLHAVADALLGAAALGDIGGIFPPGDPATRGADSSALLRTIVARVRAAGYIPVNLDVTIIAERPRIAPRVQEMRSVIAAILEVEAGCISIKGKTNEGLDATGRGEAIASHAVALVTNATETMNAEG